MGKLLMMQEDDLRRIDSLKRELKAKTKVEIVRAGLDLLERETTRRKRIKQWEKAAAAVGESSREVNSEFRLNSRLKRIAE